MHVPLLIHQLLPVLYRCASNSAGWTAFLSLLCEGLESRMAAIVASDVYSNLAFLQQAGMDAVSQQACAARFLQEHAGVKRSPSLRRAGLAAPPGGTPQDPLRPLNGFHRADVKLHNLPALPNAGLTVLRSPAQGCFTPQDTALLQQLAPHVEEVLRLQQQLSSFRQEEGLLKRLSQSFDLAYMLLDGSGRSQLLSAPAQAILQRGDGLRLLDGRLVADRAADNAQLHRMLAAACTPAAGAPCTEATMQIGRAAGTKPLQVTLQPLQVPGGSACAVLFLRDPAAQPASRARVLRQLYQLLPSEVRLAETLADGLDVKGAALHMRITENSARTLLKSVFRKLEVNSQAGLIRTVLTLPAEFA